jgi:hypothetical protein
VTRKRLYDPVEFEISTWRSTEDVQITARLNKDEHDFLQMAASNRLFAYRDIEDVLRHSVHRHVEFLAETSGLGYGGFYLTEQFRLRNEARRELVERDFCIVLDIFHNLIIHFLYWKSELASLLAESLRCHVRQMSSKRWKDVYLHEIDQIVRVCGLSPRLRYVSLNPSTFEAADGDENG